MKKRPWKLAMLGLVAWSSLWTTIVCDVPQSWPGIIVIDRDHDDWDFGCCDWDDDDDFFDAWFWWW